MVGVHHSTFNNCAHFIQPMTIKTFAVFYIAPCKVAKPKQLEMIPDSHIGTFNLPRRSNLLVCIEIFSESLILSIVTFELTFWLMAHPLSMAKFPWRIILKSSENRPNLTCNLSVGSRILCLITLITRHSIVACGLLEYFYSFAHSRWPTVIEILAIFVSNFRIGLHLIFLNLFF